MSMPKFPACNSLNREDVINQLISSVAMEELSLSHILNTEGEKLQYALGTLEGVTGPDRPITIDELLRVNDSVNKTLDATMQNQFFLRDKLKTALSASTMIGPTGPTGPTGASGTFGKEQMLLAIDGVTGHSEVMLGDTIRFQSKDGSVNVNVTQGFTIVDLSAEGIVGPKGASGATGLQGATGEPGPAGAIGETGPAGAIGETGPAGATGLQGGIGPTGDTGSQGVAGTVGTILGSFNTLADLIAAHPTGTPGDFYYVNPDLYVWDEANNDWANVGTLAGPQGLKGPIGFTGEAGPAGAVGEAGPTGATGASGPKGATGETGPMGAIGASGPKGATGETGPKGDTGEAGPTGATGETGPKGLTGDAGPKGPMGVPEYTNFKITSANTASNPIIYTVGSIDFLFTYVNATTIRLRYQPATSGTSILFDFRRISRFDSTAESLFSNATTLTTTFLADDLIYTQSNDWQNSWLRQRNPNNTWSMCEYGVFGSQSSGRITLYINWIYKDEVVVW